MFAREAVFVPVALAAQFAPTPVLRRVQLEGVRRMLRFATAHVPYYRDRAAYAHPVRSLEDLQRLPVLTKAELRAVAMEELLAEGLDRDACQHFSTSGTTGHRVRLLHDPRSYDYHMAASVRRFLATGRYRPTDRLVHLRPSPMPRRRFESLGLFRREVVLSTQPVDAWIAQLLEARPHTLLSYPVHLKRLLREMTPEQLARLRESLRMIMSESEMLRPDQRRDIESGFGVPVFDEYSSFEVLNVYYECGDGGLHIPLDRVVVEVLDERGEPVPVGAEGQVVCTAFQERGMPLVRYAMGDRGRLDPDPCACGRRFPRMHLTTGRIVPRLALPDGRELAGDVFLLVGAFVPGIDEVCVRQDARGTIRLLVVPQVGVAFRDVKTAVTTELERHLGAGVPLRVEPIDAIPLTAGGKGSFIASDYPPTRALQT